MDRVMLIHSNHRFNSHISYAFGTLMTNIGSQYSTICTCGSCPEVDEEITAGVFYGKDPPNQVDRKVLTIRPSGFFGENYLKSSSMPSSRPEMINYDGIEVPVLFGQAGIPPAGMEVLSQSDGGKFWIAGNCRRIETNIDVLSTSFYELTRYGEIVAGRTGEEFARPENIREPIVDLHAELLGKLLDPCGNHPSTRPAWPGGKKFAVCLTHDIDQVFTRTALNWYQFDLNRRGGRQILRSVPTLLARWVRNLTRARSPFWTFERIRSEEEERGFRSTFLFIPLEDESTGNDYGLAESDKMQRVARELAEGGWEVGLHTTGDWRLPEEVEAISSLGVTLYTSRYHRLAFHVPQSWNRMEDVGIKSDCSLGYNDEAGFRAGTCHPFLLFDAEEGRKIPVIELPLSLMDSTFYWHSQTPPADVYEVFEELLDVVERHGGVMVLLWHNNFFDDTFYHEWIVLYRRILDEVGRRGAFVGTAREISEWWKERKGSSGKYCDGEGAQGR